MSIQISKIGNTVPSINFLNSFWNVWNVLTYYKNGMYWPTRNLEYICTETFELFSQSRSLGLISPFGQAAPSKFCRPFSVFYDIEFWEWNTYLCKEDCCQKIYEIYWSLSGGVIWNGKYVWIKKYAILYEITWLKNAFDEQYFCGFAEQLCLVAVWTLIEAQF